METSKSQIDKAGKILKSSIQNKEELDGALNVVHKFRAFHEYPLKIFDRRLERISKKFDKNPVIARRLKRLSSIIYKLKRKYKGSEPTIKLSQMQDIAGCRSVVSSTEIARKVRDQGFLKSDIKHKLVSQKDYITYPKKDGYRSIHLVYRYESDKEKSKYNGLLIEVQIRSKLQHIWATAIEIVDFFTTQSIKLNRGKKEWKDFFRLVSSALALMEKTALVPNTPSNKKEIYRLIRDSERELKVIKNLTKWNSAIREFTDTKSKKSKKEFFLLELDLNSESIKISAYTKDEGEKALEDYARVEKIIRNKKEYDTVLVGADSIDELEKAYPNYFVDSQEFIKVLTKIIKEVEKN
ncbi:hypothetical protein CMI42_01640 [Candidatus Pacearchaeota archaeon]|nr:hypothetical protein [Candidatus Pacearchaeota archaeon]